MNTSLAEIEADLRRFLELYRRVLGLVEGENRAIRQDQAASLFEGFSSRKHMLPELEASVGRLREHRMVWTKLSPEERAKFPEVGVLLRQCQDLVMKALTLDRENEQGFLRQGLLGPRNLPPHQRQKPNFVAGLYRRQSS
ncbi:MAG: hypothetical protein RI897_1769 [Verrucomicrobiota bacterium]|jgi:hypothetical protein